MVGEYIIVGTAGHVDHGKTVLVQALTGVDTDRLREEKERGISIELGFAPLKLPSGRTLGLVDVPGHERFIRQMLAGAAGMDLVMLIISADEGVMPQTREHLDIINLLRVKKGVIVITKIDLVEEDWVELVKEEARELVRGTVLEGAPVVAVSAVTGDGLDRLRQELDHLAAATPPKEIAGRTRLPVDRVFKVPGFGTVVTGTLWSGRLNVGCSLEVQPGGLSGRVRGLQVHGHNVAEAVAGQRVAVNLSNVEVAQLRRGDMLVEAGAFRPTSRLDAEFYLLPAARSLAYRTRVRFYLGTAEVLGRIILLDREELEPGATALVQLELEGPVVAARGDRFVLRSYSPMTTIGGGEVIEPHARRHRRYRPEVLASLQARLRGTPEERLVEVLAAYRGCLGVDRLAEAAGLGTSELEVALKELEAASRVVSLLADREKLLVAGEIYRKWLADVENALADYHRRYHLRPGPAREYLRSQFFAHLEMKYFLALVERWEKEGRLQSVGAYVALPSFVPQPTATEEQALAAIRDAYRSGWWQPPDWPEVAGSLAAGEVEELLAYLLRRGELVKVADDMYFHQAALEAAKERLAAYIKEHGSVTLAEARDLLGSSRKYVLPLLEYFDQVKFTRRIGDKRVLY